MESCQGRADARLQLCLCLWGTTCARRMEVTGAGMWAKSPVTRSQRSLECWLNPWQTCLTQGEATSFWGTARSKHTDCGLAHLPSDGHPALPDAQKDIQALGLSYLPSLLSHTRRALRHANTETGTCTQALTWIQPQVHTHRRTHVHTHIHTLKRFVRLPSTSEHK